MNVLDISKYGYPLIGGYSINTDLALQRSKVQSEWTRQRRTYLHNASLITLSWRLEQSKANSLIAWLEEIPSGDFFECNLLSGNDVNAPCVISTLLIRRTSTITVTRIPRTTLFIINFDAETKEQTGYQNDSSNAANQPPGNYPVNLPKPRASNFSEVHNDRNVTEYTLTYSLDTATLARWLEFAGFMGTAWFYHPMFSTNVACENELIRYISSPNQTMIAPNAWDVTIKAETMPANAQLGTSTAPTGECTYDSFIDYNDPEESYDCEGGVIPPQGNFVMPTGTFTQSSTVVGATSATATCTIKLGLDGTVTSTPAGSPAWVAWHTDAETLISPGVKLNKVIEFSRDGTNWSFYTPTVAGVWLSLKNDLWIRLQVSGGYDQTATLPFKMTFNAEASVSPYAIDYEAICSMTSTIDLTAPVEGVEGGVDYTDGKVIVLEPGDELTTVRAGIILKSDGDVTSSTTGQYYTGWFIPTSIGIGANYWVQAVKTAGLNVLPTARTQLTAGLQYKIQKNNNDDYATSIECSWNGVLNFYNQASGGSIIATSTLNLYAKASL